MAKPIQQKTANARLIKAVAAGDVAGAQENLARGASPDARDEKGITALSHAFARIERDDRRGAEPTYELFEILLRAGADVRGVHPRRSLIHMACALRSPSLVKLLVAYGASPNFGEHSFVDDEMRREIIAIAERGDEADREMLELLAEGGFKATMFLDTFSPFPPHNGVLRNFKEWPGLGLLKDLELRQIEAVELRRATEPTANDETTPSAAQDDTGQVVKGRPRV